MFFWRSNKKPAGEIYDWLLAHKEEIRAGTAEYMGTPVTEATQLRQFEYVVSLGALSFILATRHHLPTWANGHLRFTRMKYVLISGALGWWCFPWGPLLTIRAIFVNLSGGRKRTVASLLQLIEWGWDAPDDLAPGGFRKHLLELTDRAVEAIRARRANGGFPEDVGVRISPGGFTDAEVKISFDFPVSDGRDWIDESQGLLLLIDKSDENQLADTTVDFEEGVFVARVAAKPRRHSAESPDR
jgi:Fe-S cluster assembly iron-binding protein IscA